MNKKKFILLTSGILFLPNILLGFPLKHKIEKKIDFQNFKKTWISKLDFKINFLETRLNIMKEEKQCLVSSENLKNFNICLKNTIKKEHKFRKMLFIKSKELQINRYNIFLNIINQEIAKIKNTKNPKSDKKLMKLEKAYKYVNALKEALEKSNSFAEFRKYKKQVAKEVLGKTKTRKKF